MKKMKLVSYHIIRKGTNKDVVCKKSMTFRSRVLSESEIKEAIAQKETPYNIYYKDFLFRNTVVIDDIKEVPYLEE